MNGNIEEQLGEWAAQIVGGGAMRVERLPGQASNRVYYRVRNGAESWIAMVMPGGTASEEASNGALPAELPFVNVHRYLAQLGVRVPHIHRYDEHAGRMLLEDLGDVTFEAALSKGSKEALYAQAVDLLAAMHARAEREPDAGCLAFSRAFDRELFRWELDHFYVWGLVARTGLQPTTPEREVLDRAFDRIAEEMDGLPRGFTHRDYQSRNLMVKAGELVVIDFQDALQGPRPYDLVALLRDSYVELDRPFVEKMVARYVEQLGQQGGTAGDFASFLRAFDLVTVQRKLKDGGRFVFIDRVKQNPSFLPSVPASFRYVKEALTGRPDLADAREVLARYVPEIA